MIKICDLRIGNYLQDKVTGAYLKVTGLSESNIETYVIDRSKFPLPDGWKLDPIPLMPEVLEKCGFEKQSKYEYSIEINPFGKLLIIGIYDSGISPMIVELPELSTENTVSICLHSIQYLHQLMNLFYSLTGTELAVLL